MLISIESTSEGAGKTTQARLLADYLDAKYIKFPDGPYRELILGSNLDPKSHLLVQAANFREGLKDIKPGDTVVLDRYIDSTIAYQGWGFNLDLGEIRRILDYATDSRVPDKTILLDLDPLESHKRLLARGEQDRIAQKHGQEFSSRVREGFLSLSQMYSHRITLIDASGSIAEVRSRIINHVR